jgi:hypothetical protein
LGEFKFQTKQLDYVDRLAGATKRIVLVLNQNQTNPLMDNSTLLIRVYVLNPDMKLWIFLKQLPAL